MIPISGQFFFCVSPVKWGRFRVCWWNQMSPLVQQSHLLQLYQLSIYCSQLIPLSIIHSQSVASLLFFFLSLNSVMVANGVKDERCLLQRSISASLRISYEWSMNTRSTSLLSLKDTKEESRSKLLLLLPWVRSILYAVNKWISFEKRTVFDVFERNVHGLDHKCLLAVLHDELLQEVLLSCRETCSTM